MSRRQFTRRRFLATTAAASAVAIGAPYVRTSRAAGKLSVGFWDHWVPGANDTLTAICQEWAKKENVELKIDYITSQGNKIMMTATAESQAQSGHDILQFLAWYPLSLAKSLEPVDDVMGSLLKENGRVSGDRVPRQEPGSLAGRAGGDRHAGEAALRAHRPAQVALRHRCAGDVSGGQAADQGSRELELGQLRGRG